MCVCCLNLDMSLSYLTSTFSSVKWVYMVSILPTFQCSLEARTDHVWMLSEAFSLYPWLSNCDDVYGESDKLCPIYLPILITWLIDVFLLFQTFEFLQEKRYHQRVQFKRSDPFLFFFFTLPLTLFTIIAFTLWLTKMFLSVYSNAPGKMVLSNADLPSRAQIIQVSSLKGLPIQ